MTKIRYLKLQRINRDNLQKVEENLSSSFLQTLTPPYLPQKKIKNLILKEHFKFNEDQLVNANLYHKRESDFFSASYSWDQLLLGIAKEKIGVDLELIKSRDQSLLKVHEKELKYSFCKADWNTFYRLRTAREAILKVTDTQNLDLIDQSIFLWMKKISERIWDIYFDYELNFAREDKELSVKSFKKGELIWAITFLPR